jgi:hypothetical protein
MLMMGAARRRDAVEPLRPPRPRPRAGVLARIRADGWMMPLADRKMAMVMMMVHRKRKCSKSLESSVSCRLRQFVADLVRNVTKVT